MECRMRSRADNKLFGYRPGVSTSSCKRCVVRTSRPHALMQPFAFVVLATWTISALVRTFPFAMQGMVMCRRRTAIALRSAGPFRRRFSPFSGSSFLPWTAKSLHPARSSICCPLTNQKGDGQNVQASNVSKLDTWFPFRT